MQRDWLHLGPLQWTTYVNKELQVTAGMEAKEFAGWLLTIDPVSASLVLVSLGEEGKSGSIRVVMGHAVRRVEVLREADATATQRLRQLFASPTCGGPDPQRRAAVRRWLERNRIPVEECADRLRVASALTLAPPYGPDDCSGANPVVLERVRKLLERQPRQEVDQELVPMELP
ncbi:gem-associated protein 6 [Syngnathus typhle]|uniref:gem-associated protein 6 n=1 Tax=Syngnathus typhle TaxID=161592 RepID=UPI002A6A7975|nr:gem-associated protein 6 [Syngnathus typhle]XP_061129274.1 gem-associated protein 6 [Syngnathus typhle]